MQQVVEIIIAFAFLSFYEIGNACDGRGKCMNVANYYQAYG